MKSTLIGFTLAAIVGACSNQGSPADAVSSAALEAAAAAFTIQMLDRCEPVSFNDAVGPGTCVGDGKVTFGEFIAELQKKQTHLQWRFQPTQVSLNADRPVTVVNVGGETHTFTPVAEFGGGFLPDLNELSGNPVPAPECLDFGSIAFLPPGSVTPLSGLSQGTHLFECCIHPWMRTTLEVHR